MTDSKLIEQTAALQITSTPPTSENTNLPLNQSTKDQLNNDEDNLQRFTHWDNNEGDLGTDDTTTSTDGRGGWSVEEMFKTNQKLGVASTFKDDLTQYTTCPPIGTKEDYERATRLAREIERSEDSKRMAFYENDDEERDLDKETIVPRDVMGGHDRRDGNRKPRGGKSFPFKRDTSIPENHRANALRDFGPSNNNNQQRNRQQDFGGQRDRGNMNKPYSPSATAPSGQANTGSSSDAGSPRPNQTPSSDTPPDSANEAQTQANTKSQTMYKRAEDLRSWGNNFSQVYRPTAPANGASPPVQQQQSSPQPYPYNVPPPAVVPQPSEPKPSVPRPTNAWQKGPPPSFVVQPQHQQPPTAQPQLQIQPQQIQQIQQQQIMQAQQQQQQYQYQSQPQQVYIGGPYSQPPPTMNPQLVPPQQSLPNTIVSSQQYPSKQPSPTEVPPNDPPPSTNTITSVDSEGSNASKSFKFDPNAPSFVPRTRTPSAPISAATSIISMQPQHQPQQQQQQAQYIAQALPPQSYASHQGGLVQHPQGYVFQTMPHSPNILPQTAFIQQPMQLISNAVPIYNQQIVSSAQGYPSFISHQPQVYGGPPTNAYGIQQQPQAPAPQYQIPQQYQIGQPISGPPHISQVSGVIPQPISQQLPYSSQPQQLQQGGIKKFGPN